LVDKLEASNVLEQAEKEANRSLYNKKIEAQLMSLLADMREDVQRYPAMRYQEK